MPELLADFGSAPARHAVQRWAEGSERPTDRALWEATLADLDWAESIQGRNPVLQESLGNALVVGSSLPGTADDERLRLLKRAQQHYQQSIALRPTEGMTWALLAEALARAGDFGPALQEAAEKALAYGPNESHVQQALLLTVMHHWDPAPQALKDWVGEAFETGTAERRRIINQVGAAYGVKLESDNPPRAKAPERAPSPM